MDLFDTLHNELQSRKIEKRERRGYAAAPVAWQSHKKQKYACTSCKRTFPRMEVLLQHFRDSSRHSQEAISQEASVQMANWLLAKDQRQHCCPICCLGFKTDTELFVHLKHTEVHKGTMEAQQASVLLLPKDEARLLRRNLQGSPLAILQAPSPFLQQHFSEVPQSASDVQSPAKASPHRPRNRAAKPGQEQEPLSQRDGSDGHSSVSPSNDPGPVVYLGCADQTAAPNSMQSCAEYSQTASAGSQHDAEESRPEADAIQDELKGPFNAKVLTAEKGKGATLACSRFHVDSLKTLQRRTVAKKRKRRSDSAADAESHDSAASSCELATMTFIEPHSRQAVISVGDHHQAKKQC